MATEAEIAWAAGVFEGEGCLRVAKTGHVQLSLSMVDRDVVERFAALAACGNVYAHKPSRPAHWQQQYTWAVGARESVRDLVLAWLPYFGERRAARARDVLEAIRRLEEARAEPRRCRACGADFTDEEVRGRRRVFCSPTCRQLWWDRSRWSNRLESLA